MKTTMITSALVIILLAESLFALRQCEVFFLNTKGSRIKASASTAVSDEERSRGLMFRRSLPSDSGMLFIFAREERLTFWMKNTYIPLSIAFIDSSGIIVDIRDMIPHDETLVASMKPALYALEMNLGWFKKNHIEPGCRMIKDGCIGK